MSSVGRLITLPVVCMLLACARGNSPDGAVSDTAGATPSEPVPRTPVTQPPSDAPDDETIRRLEREARALAQAEGCETSGQCRTAPVGNRPCGGPRSYLVYCSLTTDSVALFRKLEELSRTEGEYNRQHGLASTCEFRTPPDVVLSAGRCQAAP